MSDDSERFWNLLIYKMYVTNKEMEEIGPVIVILLVIVIVVLGWWFSIFAKSNKDPDPSIHITSTSNVLQLEKEDIP